MPKFGSQALKPLAAKSGPLPSTQIQQTIPALAKVQEKNLKNAGKSPDAATPSGASNPLDPVLAEKYSAITDNFKKNRALHAAVAETAAKNMESKPDMVGSMLDLTARQREARNAAIRDEVFRQEMELDEKGMKIPSPLTPEERKEKVKHWVTSDANNFTDGPLGETQYPEGASLFDKTCIRVQREVFREMEPIITHTIQQTIKDTLRKEVSKAQEISSLIHDGVYTITVRNGVVEAPESAEDLDIVSLYLNHLTATHKERENILNIAMITAMKKRSDADKEEQPEEESEPDEEHSSAEVTHDDEDSGK